MKSRETLDRPEIERPAPLSRVEMPAIVSSPRSPTPTLPNRVCANCGKDDVVLHTAAPDRFHGRAELYQLVRCSSCSLVWLNNAPPENEMPLHYGSDYDQQIAQVGETKLEARWRIPHDVLHRYKPAGSLLDLGCSSGAFLRSLNGQRWELYGTEFSASSARIAESTSGAEVFVGDIIGAPYPAEKFDAITCFHVLEHMYHPREILARVREWLKPGGVFITFLPNIDSGAARIFKSYWYALELPRHVYHFSPKTLSDLGRSVGLRELSITTHREPFFEHSSRYILDDMLHRAGLTRLPLARAKSPSLPWKVARKIFRITLLPALDRAFAFSGPGELIHAVFEKAPQR
jgi:2-polyprenyl-3-methyl-5-hydroxy-6-metoxy-1,4-benzoquinol methylase